MKPSFGTGSNGQRRSNDADSRSRESLTCSKVEFSRVLKLNDVLAVENASRVRRLCACKNPKKSIFGRCCSLALATCKDRGKAPAWVSALGSGKPLAAGLSLGSRLRKTLGCPPATCRPVSRPSAPAELPAGLSLGSRLRRPLAAGRKLQLRLRLLTAGRGRLLRMRPRRSAR